MKPQQFQFGDQPWPDGEGVLQVYAPIDLGINPELAELVRKCRAACQGAPVTEVDDRFLHTTLVISSCQVKCPVNQITRFEARKAGVVGGRSPTQVGARKIT